jgi:magnesium transporter
MSDREIHKLIKIILSEDLLDHNVVSRLNALHPADIANLIESLPSEQRKKVWKSINLPLKGEVFLEVRGEVRDQLINSTEAHELVTAVSQLQIDELADLDKKLPRKVVTAVVNAMDKQQKSRYEAVKDYPDDTAGGLMDIDEIAIRSDITIYVALRYLKFLRQKYKTMPEHLDSVYVVDRENKYLGVVALKDLVSLPYHTLITSITNTKIKPIQVSMHEKKVAQIFEDRDLISAPVVDDNQRLIGRITVDDIIDVIRKEGEHMMMTPAGLSEKSDVFSPIIDSVKYRTLWLGINLINAFIAAITINLFTHSIEKVVSLAVLMPIIASMGGVVGNQTLTLVTRGIALDQITPENMKRLFIKEVSVGLINGFFWALAVSLIVVVWMQNLRLAAVCGIAMMLSLFMSTCAGTVIPVILSKLKIDPALAGSVLLVAVTDVLGFFIFLGIATLLILN